MLDENKKWRLVVKLSDGRKIQGTFGVWEALTRYSVFRMYGDFAGFYLLEAKA